MTKEHWKQNPDKETTKYVLHLADPEKWWACTVKFDGCVDLTKYFNRPASEQTEEEDCDCMHICDIDEHIEMLKALKKKAIEHFGTQWPE